MLGHAGDCTMTVPQPPQLPTPPPTRYIRDYGDKRKMNIGEIPVTQFLYGMWFMWFCLCVFARDALTTQSFAVGALLIPGLLFMVARGLWFVVRLVKFKWERRNRGPL